MVIRIKPDPRNIWKVNGVGGALKLSNDYADKKLRSEQFEFGIEKLNDTDQMVDAAYICSDNTSIYKEVAEDVVNSFMMGTNSLIFAYGQTGSGKTYSMMGQDGNPGIIPSAIN